MRFSFFEKGVYAFLRIAMIEALDEVEFFQFKMLREQMIVGITYQGFCSLDCIAR